ncbi:uncharacterized protein LOC106472345 [Limulus polyphemus]|uniref:Uncharacterized protein LOC106472345 n=1 Tax=Limulus polyphemus TaxID=6850 RepID=A0ABM1TL91_LIMPO|nr:uncharacterized protein LOC106472345 [Limulus polyphemus]
MGNSNSRSVTLPRTQSSVSSMLQKDDAYIRNMSKVRVFPQPPGSQMLRATENGIFLQNEGTITGKKAQRSVKQATGDVNPELVGLLHKRLKLQEAYYRDSSVRRGFFGSNKAYSDPDIVHSMLNWHDLLDGEKDEVNSIYNSRSLIALSPSEAKIKARKKSQEFGRFNSSSLPRDFNSTHHLDTRRNVDQFNSHKKSFFSKLRNNNKNEKKKDVPGCVQNPVIPTPDYSTESEEPKIEDGDDKGYYSQEFRVESRVRNSYNENGKNKKTKRSLYDLNKKHMRDEDANKAGVETYSSVSTNSKKQTQYEAFNKELCTNFIEDIPQRSNCYPRNQNSAFSESQINRIQEESKTNFDPRIAPSFVKVSSQPVIPFKSETTNSSCPQTVTTNNKDYISSFDYQDKYHTSEVTNKVNVKYRDKPLAHIKNMSFKQNQCLPVQQNQCLPVQQNQCLPVQQNQCLPVQQNQCLPVQQNQCLPVHVCGIYSSAVKEKSQLNLKNRCGQASPYLNASGLSSESSLSDEEDIKISVKLKPILPRKQLQLPRFSPTEAWRSLFSDAQQSGASSEGEEEVKLHQINRPMAPPRLFTDRCGDSGISPDAGSPALMNDTFEVLFSDSKQWKSLQNGPLLSEEIQESFTFNKQHDPVQWTPAQDLDDSERESEEREFEGVISATPIQPKPAFLNNLCTDHYISRNITESNGINVPPCGSPEPMHIKSDDKYNKTNKKNQQHFNSLRNLKKAFGFRGKLSTLECVNNVDSNWHLSRSVPDNIDNTEKSEISNLDYRHLERSCPGSLVDNPDKELQQGKLIPHSEKECMMYLPGYGVTCMEKHRDNVKTSTLQKETKPIHTKKKNKFTFQGTFRKEEKRRLEEKLINEVVEKERLREAEMEWMSRVEEEFRKQRDTEKLNLRSQLRVLNQHSSVYEPQKDNSFRNFKPRNELRPDSQNLNCFSESGSLSVSSEKTKGYEDGNTTNEHYYASVDDPRINKRPTGMGKWMLRNQHVSVNTPDPLNISQQVRDKMKSVDLYKHEHQLKPLYSEAMNKDRLESQLHRKDFRNSTKVSDVYMFHPSDARQVIKLEKSKNLYLPHTARNDNINDKTLNPTYVQYNRKEDSPYLNSPTNIVSPSRVERENSLTKTSLDSFDLSSSLSTNRDRQLPESKNNFSRRNNRNSTLDFNGFTEPHSEKMFTRINRIDWI